MAAEFSGRYIVLEGLEGAGKGTQKDMLQAHLERCGVGFIVVREPGGTPAGESIRNILKSPAVKRSPAMNVEWFTLARRILTEEVIVPALTEGLMVLSDRSWVTTYAYQGYSEGFSTKRIISLTRNKVGPVALQAEVILLDADPIDIANRRSEEEKLLDYFDGKPIDYFVKARAGYLDAAKKFGYSVVDAFQPREKVHNDIVHALNLVG